MFCSKCGIELPDDSRFCRSCGQTLGTVSTGGGAAAAVAPARVVAPESKPKTRSGRIPLFVGIVVLVCVAGLWLQQNASHQNAQLPVAQARAPQPQLHTETTGDKAFTLNAGGVYSFKLPVAAGAYNVNLKGHFSASGGGGNDVEAFLITEDNYVNWENGHSVTSLYNSGKVTQETLNVTLPPDAATYYLVFSNKFSLLTPKAVQANIVLTYYTR